MAKGTDFGGVHSFHDLHLIQQTVDIQPAQPKLNLIDVPGADGSKDLSDRPAGRIVYNDRTVTWTFALYPYEDWDAKHQQVSNALNGRRCRITLDSDPVHYFQGRLSVKKYKKDGLLRQITVEAICHPWVLKQEPTVVSATFNNTGILNEVHLFNEGKPVIPTIELTHDARLWLGDRVDSISAVAGSHSFPDLVLSPGENILRVRFDGGVGTITVTYQEGSL